jgi:hypothetical protein
MRADKIDGITMISFPLLILPVHRIQASPSGQGKVRKKKPEAAEAAEGFALPAGQTTLPLDISRYSLLVFSKVRPPLLPAAALHRRIPEAHRRVFHSLEKMIGTFPLIGKIVSTRWKPPASHSWSCLSHWRRRPCWPPWPPEYTPPPYKAAQAASCRSNLRQLAAANHAYALDHGRFVAAASDVDGNNRMRRHGMRRGSSFDATDGPRTPYLGGKASSEGLGWFGPDADSLFAPF